MSLDSPKHLLLVDDDPHVLAFLSDFLTPIGFSVMIATSGPEALRILKQNHIDIVLLDEQLPNLLGHALITPMREIHPGLPIIIMTGLNSVQNAVETIQHGANDYLVKPLNLEDLFPRLERALNVPAQVLVNHEDGHSSGHALPLAHPVTIQNLFPFGYYEGTSAVRARIRDEISELAAIPKLCGLILGETGIGKDIAAKRIHVLGASRNQPFLVVNCTSISDEQWESDLFGVENGSQQKAGILETASTGTVLFDEITSLSPRLQSHLLHLLDQRSFHRMGGRKNIPLMARCLFSTNQPLPPLIQQGLFRQDFYYRISMFTLNLPPLRHTPEDILPLAAHFLTHFNSHYKKSVTQIPPSVQEALLNHGFPGNILELCHLIERSVIGSSQSMLVSEPILDCVAASRPRPLSLVLPEPEFTEKAPATPMPKSDAIRVLDSPQSLEEIEIVAVRNAIAACKGNKSKAAKLLGISRRALYRRIEKIPDLIGDDKFDTIDDQRDVGSI